MIRLFAWWGRGLFIMGAAYIVFALILGPLYVGLRFSVWQFHLSSKILIPSLEFFIFLAFLYGTGNWVLSFFIDMSKAGIEKRRGRRRFGFLGIDQGYDAVTLNDLGEVEIDRKRLNALLEKKREFWTEDDYELYAKLAYLDPAGLK